MDGVIDPKVLARRQKDVDGFVDQYEELLQARVKKYGSRIRPTWERTAQRLDLQVKKLYALYANTDGKLNEKKLATIKYSAGRLDILKKSILKALEPAEKSITDSMTNNLVYEYAKSYHFTAFGLEQAAKVAVEVPSLTVSHVMGVIANPWLPDGAAYSDRLRSNTQYLADKMYQAIGQATVEGWGVQETAARIRQTAGEGFFNSIRLARTEFTRAASQGATHLYMENADILDGKRWNATLDSRTAPKDARNDGKVYPLEYDTAESPGKPGERIPNHPHCRCRWTPILSALGISTKERIARGEGDTPDEWGERTYTKARTYEEYAKERGLPNLADRLANDDPRRYLRRGEAAAEGPLVGKTWKAPTVPQPKTPAAPTPAAAAAPATTYTPLNDVKKATAWAQKNLPIDYVSYKGFAPELADECNESLQQLFTRFPVLKGRTKWIGTAQERNRQYLERVVEDSYQAYLKQYAGRQLPWKEADYRAAAKRRLKPKTLPSTTYAQSANKTWGPQEGIAFNEVWAKDYAKFAQAKAFDVSTAWKPVGTGKPAGTVFHEFGHQLDYFLKENGLRGEIDAIYARVSAQGSGYMRNSLSGYSAENTSEFFAEAFSEYMLNPNPRPIAKEVGEAIEKAIAEYEKRG